MNRTVRRYWLARIIAPLGMLLAVAGCGGDDGAVGTPPVATFALSGTVSHLDTAGLTVSNGTETVPVAQGASSFAFAKPLADGTAYAVTVATQPAGMNCVVSNGSGSVGGATVGNVAIACNTRITQPLTLGVLASISSFTGGPRILLPVSQVGTAATTINAILDTGSSGTLLRASDIFPASMVSSTGFVFPAGQTSLTYNGITVTNVGATRVYGAGGTTILNGNLGFAQITFGSGTHITTAMTPILFVYSRVVKDGVNPSPSFGNIIGVNPSNASFTAGDSTSAEPVPACTPQLTTSCGLASSFRYLDYAEGIDKGFVLSKVTLTACDSATAGSCPTSPNLTIGVTANGLAGFSTFALPSCGSATIFGGKAEPVCKQVIPSVTVSSGTDSFTGPMIFDSGTPSASFAIPQGMTFMPAGTIVPTSGLPRLPAMLPVTITTPSGFVYQYSTAASGPFDTTVSATSTNAASNTGIGFFTLNSLVLDYSKAMIGWRNGG